MDKYLESKGRSYDNCFIKLDEWMKKDGRRCPRNDGYDPERYLFLINNFD